MLQQILDKIRKTGNPAAAISGSRFFKEPVNLYGLKSAESKQIIKEYAPLIDKMDKSAVFELVTGMMADNHLESQSIASEFVYRKRKDFEKSDFKTFEKWVNTYITNWANCDVFCNHSMNALIEMYPDLVPQIKKWAHSNNRWVKRGSAVTFIISARHGRFIDDVFEIADILLTDPDDMVQKGYGWALKAAGQHDPQRVYDFVAQRASKMPRTAFRYAIEKLPPEMRKSAMKL